MLCHKTGRGGRCTVSTVSPAKQSNSESTDHPGGQSDTNSPLIAVTTVVSTSTTSVCRPPSHHSISPGPTVTTGVCLGWQVVPSACMKTLMQHNQAACFAKEVSRLAAAPRRPSTNRMNDDRWLRFAHWAAGQGIDRLGPTAAQIATFLYYLFDSHGLPPQTIKGYLSCIASVLSHTINATVVQAKTTCISEMMASMDLQRPRMTPVLPQWDLGIVLEALRKPPYELLREASLKHLTLKTFFLLAMASARRRSELQALMFDPQYIQFKQKGAGVTLYFSPKLL